MYLSDTYNGHFTGSQAWSLFCPEALALEKAYNTNLRVLNDVPRTTHTWLLDTISGRPHIKATLLKRLLKFIKMVQDGNKINILNSIQEDCRSTTGSNLRSLMLALGASNVREPSPDMVSGLVYSEVPAGQDWRSSLLGELLDAREDNEVLKDFTSQEINDLLCSVCTD